MSDIAMLLLIFFIMTTEFVVQRSLPTQLPSPTPEKEKASENLIQVVVAQDAIYLDAEKIALQDVAPYLAAKLADKVETQDRAVVLDAESTVPYERVVQTANEIKRAGGLITMMKVKE
jgi:biopolymer transport protein ExbD